MLMKMLGIDYGDRYVGFSSCDDDEILAYPLKAVKVKSMKDAITATEEIVQTERPQKIIIGLPLMPDGVEGERASKTRAFGRVVARVTELPVEFYDERLTTVQAEEFLEMNGIKKCDMKKYTDELSAQIILNDYINATRQRS